MIHCSFSWHKSPSPNPVIVICLFIFSTWWDCVSEDYFLHIQCSASDVLPQIGSALGIFTVWVELSFSLSLTTVPMWPATFWSILDASGKTPFFIIFHKKFNKNVCTWTTSLKWFQCHINIPGKDSNWPNLGMCLPRASVWSGRWDSITD